MARRKAVPEISALDESGRPIMLQTYRARQRNLLLVLLHGGECRDCAQIASELAQRRAEVEGWDSDILAVSSGNHSLSASIPQAVDFGGITYRQYDLDSDAVVCVLEFRGR